jgi:signal transduction histidine kinase
LDDALQAPLGRIVQLVDQAHESLLSITFQISPPSLHDLGLVAALQWLGEDIGRKHGCTVRIEDASPPPVADESVRAILFRAVREVLVECAPHADGHEVVVHLERQENQIRITLSGLGVGVDGAGLDRHDGALFGLREQLRYVNGSLQVASEPVGGTRVILTAPTEDHLAESTT